MSVIDLAVVAVGVSMDAMAVAIAVSLALGKPTGHRVFRLAFHFGLFQAMMFVTGWMAGQTVGPHIEMWDHWVAFAVLGVIGCRAIAGAFRDSDEPDRRADATRGMRLVALSIATSIDALAVGLGVAVLHAQMWIPAIIIGLTTGGLSVVGMVFGSRLGSRLGKRAEILGGVVLVGIGVKILIQHSFQ
ncbi:MAG: manganese efflux pump [Nitrospiraceae bacterium]|nr:manganese efflux pump [Nitrospiraceae bacterium]